MLLILTVAVLVSSATALALAWRIRRRNATGHFLILLAGALAASGTLLLVLLAAFFAAVFEPWPLSLRQGPDTEFSRSCLADVIEGQLPPGVTLVYCRQQWTFGGDRVISIRFAYDAPATLNAIVSRLHIQPVTAPILDAGRPFRQPSWWPERPTLARAREVYQRLGADVLWVHPESNIAFLQRADASVRGLSPR